MKSCSSKLVVFESKKGRDICRYGGILDDGRACNVTGLTLLNCNNNWLARRDFCSRNKTEANRAVEPLHSEINIRDDPEMRSILDEIAQHFQDECDASSQMKTIGPFPQKEAYNTNHNKSKIASQHLKDKFSVYNDAEAPVILNVHEEHEQIKQCDIKPIESGTSQSAKLCWQRGVLGVFDIEEFIDVLLAENARDVCVIKVNPELLYTNFLVVACGHSTRHLKAIAEFINKIYKRKKSPDDEYVAIQGKDSKTWLAMDMGNIVLHLFLPEERAKYDIETLWSVGPEYDDSCQKVKDCIDGKLQVHLDYLDRMKPLHN